MIRTASWAIGLALLATNCLPAQISIDQRFVQIRSIDIQNGVLELHNFGELDQPLNGWRFCSHDEDQMRQYTAANALNGMNLAAGTSIFIHFNNDANGADPTQINRSSIAGNFALPMDTDGAYAIQIYWQTPFGAGANIADHVQFSLDGADDAMADERSDEAQNGGVWVNQKEWVSVQANTESIVLKKTSSGNELHSPADYDVFNRMTIILGDVNCDNVVNLLDVAPFVVLLSTGDFDVKADINEDGVVNLLDIDPFIEILNGP